MPTHLHRLLLFLITGVIAVPCAALVNVSFTNPERYTDAASSYLGRSEPTQREIEEHLKALGERYLAPGNTLTLEVLDIDLAGRYEPFAGDGNPLRIVRDRADFPSMKVRYVLQAEGRILASGEESIADKSYLFYGSRFSSNIPLSYEKRMLSDWFKARFVERPPTQRPRLD